MNRHVRFFFFLKVAFPIGIYTGIPVQHEVLANKVIGTREM